jgi:vancomycin permeability regulator SanA
MNDAGENMTAYVRYRLEKAQEVYQAAKVLYDASQWNYYE